MTEKEILNLQEENGQSAYYLMLVGTLYHAYGCGAFALARATGYRVVRKHRRGGEILTCGFPMSQLDTVVSRVRAAGGSVEAAEGKTYLFSGLDGTPDEKLIAEQRPQTVTPSSKEVLQSEVPFSWLADELLSFNLSLSTPMDAMNLIARLQKRLREEQKKQEESPGHQAKETTILGIACESPAGHGLQE